MKPRTLTLGAFTFLTLLFCICVGSQSAHASGGLLLFTSGGSSYVSAVQYETFTSPSAHLSYITVKGGQKKQIQSSGIIAQIPFPSSTSGSPEDSEEMISQTEMLASKYPQYAKLLQSVGELWKRKLEADKLTQAQPKAVVAAPQSSDPSKIISEGAASPIPSVVTKSGQTLKNVQITRFEDDKAVISHDGGIGRLLISDIADMSAFPPDAKAAIEKAQAGVDAKRKAEADRIATDKMEKDRIAKEEEDKRLAQIEQERKAKEAEEQRLTAEKQEKERVAAEKQKQELFAKDTNKENESGTIQSLSNIEEAKAKYNADAMGEFWSAEYLDNMLSILESERIRPPSMSSASESRAFVLLSILSYARLPNLTTEPFKSSNVLMLNEHNPEYIYDKFKMMAWCAYIPPNTIRMAGLAERILLGPFIGLSISELTKEEKEERKVWNTRVKDAAFSFPSKTDANSLTQEEIEYLVYINELESAIYMMSRNPLKDTTEHAELISDMLAQAFTSKNHAVFCLRDEPKQLWDKAIAGSVKWFPRSKSLDAVSQTDYLMTVYLPLVAFANSCINGGSSVVNNDLLDMADAALESQKGNINMNGIEIYKHAAFGMLKCKLSYNSLFSMFSINYINRRNLFTQNQRDDIIKLFAAHEYTECAARINGLMSTCNDIAIMGPFADFILNAIGDPGAVSRLPSRNPAVIQDNGESELRKYYIRKGIDNEKNGEWRSLVGRE